MNNDWNNKEIAVYFNLLEAAADGVAEAIEKIRVLDAIAEEYEIKCEYLEYSMEID